MYPAQSGTVEPVEATIDGDSGHELGAAEVLDSASFGEEQPEAVEVVPDELVQVEDERQDVVQPVSLGEERRSWPSGMLGAQQVRRPVRSRSPPRRRLLQRPRRGRCCE